MLRSSTLVAEENAVVLPENDDVRTRALERLYLRREAVDALIRSLETYQQTEAHRARCVSISAGRTCS
jgi:hypothetical protein